MDTQAMKEAALQKALADPGQSGTEEIINFNRTWKLTCGCHKLTQFGFYLFRSTGPDSWHPHCDIDERAARTFLYGMGQE